MFEIFQKIKIVDKYSHYNGAIGRFKRYLPHDNMAEVFLFDHMEVHTVFIENLEGVK